MLQWSELHGLVLCPAVYSFRDVMSSVLAFLHSPIGPDLVTIMNVDTVIRTDEATAELHHTHREYSAAVMKMVKMKRRRPLSVKPVLRSWLWQQQLWE